MTSATEHLREMLDVRGVEYRTDDANTVWATHWRFGECGSALFTEYDDGECVFVTSGNSWTPEQAIAATLGGRLTAEQVRRIIERNFGKVAVLDNGKPVEWRDDWVCKVGIDYTAIADELNATLGAGECEVEYVSEWMGWHCKSCDTLWQGLPDQKPSFCMRCGKAVKR